MSGTRTASSPTGRIRRIDGDAPGGAGRPAVHRALCTAMGGQGRPAPTQALRPYGGTDSHVASLLGMTGLFFQCHCEGAPRPWQSVIPPALYLLFCLRRGLFFLGFSRRSGPWRYLGDFCRKRLVKGRRLCYTFLEKQKCGSLRMRQHPQTCAGGRSTYTTAIRPHRMEYYTTDQPFL